MRIYTVCMLVVAAMLVVSAPLALSATGQAGYPRAQTLIVGGDSTYVDKAFNIGLGYPSVNQMMELVWMPLAVYNYTTGEYNGMIAKSWAYSTDGLTFTITIRPEAKHSNGLAVTAEDVKFSMELCNKTNHALDPAVVTKIETSGTDKVVITLGSANNRKVLSYLAFGPMFDKATWASITAATDWKTFKNNDYTKIVSNGPYRPIAQELGKTVVLQKVAGWWGASILGDPAPTYIVIVGHASNDIAQREFGVGSTDWCSNNFPGALSYCKENKNTTVVWDINNAEGKIFPTSYGISLVPDIHSTAQPGLHNSTFRQAIAYALDMNSMIAITQQGLTPRMRPDFITSPTIASAWSNFTAINEIYGGNSTWNNGLIPYSKTKAVALLKDVCDNTTRGWTFNGVPVNLKFYSVPGWDDVIMMCALFIANLADIEVTATLNLVEDSKTWEYYVDGNYNGFIHMNRGAPAPNALSPVQDWDAQFTGSVGTNHTYAWRNAVNYNASVTGGNATWVQEAIAGLWSKDWTLAATKNIGKDISEVLAAQLPMIPLYNQVTMARSHNTYWIGWANSTNNYQSQTAPHINDAAIPIVLHIKATGVAAPGFDTLMVLGALAFMGAVVAAVTIRKRHE